MRALIDEAIKLESNIFGEWNREDAHRLEEIWLELKQPYAHLYGERHLGDSVGAGWWSGLLGAFEKISEVMKSAPEHRFAVKQIKEKFGGLRFYYVIYKVGAEEETWPPAEDAVRDELHDKISVIIRELDEATHARCEICGEHGVPRNNGWVKTLCDTHDEVQKKRNKRRHG